MEGNGGKKGPLLPGVNPGAHHMMPDGVEGAAGRLGTGEGGTNALSFGSHDRARNAPLELEVP